MSKTSVIKKLKVMFGMELQFAEAKLTDGTVVNYEELVEGKELYIVTEEGNVLAGPGEYTLEDGTVITADENGLITTIVKPDSTEEVDEEMSIYEPRFLALEQAIATLIDKYDELLAKLETPTESELYSEMKAELENQKELITKLSKQPAVEPAMFSKVEEKPLTSEEKRKLALKELQKKI